MGVYSVKQEIAFAYAQGSESRNHWKIGFLFPELDFQRVLISCKDLLKGSDSNNHKLHSDSTSEL